MSIPNKPKFYQATVARVIDGDTIDVQYNFSIYRIRVKDIDAPEMSQPQGWEAFLFLKNAIDKKTVFISTDKLGKWDREVASVYDENMNDMGKKLIESGFAWNASDFKSENMEDYKAYHEIAKSQKIGLWQLENPINPRQWRERNLKMSDEDQALLEMKKEKYKTINKLNKKTQIVTGDIPKLPFSPPRKTKSKQAIGSLPFSPPNKKHSISSLPFSPPRKNKKNKPS